jgi:hypothetical protein
LGEFVEPGREDRSHHAHAGAGLEQPGDFLLGYAAAPDHDARAPVEFEGDRIPEAHQSLPWGRPVGAPTAMNLTE